MKNKILKSINFGVIALLLISVTLIYSCKKEKVNTLGAVPTASQVLIQKTAGVDANHWVLKNVSTTNGIAYWDLGNGSVLSGDSVVAFYPDVDTYTIALTLVTSGGMASSSITHSQTTPDPKAGNLVKGGKLATAADIAQWTIQRINDSVNSSIVFANGWSTVTNVAESWGQLAIYQPIQVVAGQKYKVDLSFKTAGVNNGWFKIYACLTQPTQMVEYTGAIAVTEIAIWGSVGAKSGLLSNIFNPTAGIASGDIVTFATSGTIWLEIQAGAENLMGGVSFTNIQFRGVQ